MKQASNPNCFQYDEIGAVGKITFSRPERLNSLTFQIYAELRDTFAALQRNDAVRAVVITGRGR